jgi:hypothetical protein
MNERTKRIGIAEYYFGKYTPKAPKRRLRFNAVMSVKCEGSRYLAFKEYCTARETTPSAMLRALLDDVLVEEKRKEETSAG